MLLFRLIVLTAVLSVTIRLVAADNLFVLEVANSTFSTVHTFDASGVDLGKYADATAAGLIAPIYIAFDSSNNLYVEDYGFPGGNQVHKWGPNGADLGVFAKTGINGPEGIAFDANGILYVANNNDGNILRFDTNGNSLGTFANVPGALGIAFDTSGNLFVRSTASIRKISSTGTDLGAIVSRLGFGNDVAVDSSGNVYANLKGGDNQVRKYTSSGASLGVFASVLNPGYMAFDRDGNLFVANTSSYSIQKFDPQGQSLGTFASSYPGYPSSFAFNSVPEPSTLALLGLGGLGLLMRRRR